MAAGFNLCVWKGQLWMNEKDPHLLAAWFLSGQKASEQAPRGQSVKEREFPSTLTFQAAFLCPSFLHSSGISGLLVRQSHCLYQSLGFPWPLLSLSATKCCTLAVYLIFCRGLAGKGHSRVSLDHTAATERSWSHCHRCRKLPPSRTNPSERCCGYPRDWLIYVAKYRGIFN